MPIKIQAPDGSVALFPDGTSDDTIKAVMAKTYGAPKPAPSLLDSAVDAVRSIPGGLAKGVAALGGAGGDLRDMATGAIRAAGNYVSPGAGDTAANVADTIAHTTAGLGGPTSPQLSASFSKPTGGYYQPQTTPGKYAETIASFVPSAFGGEGSLPARAARVALPAIGSELAGEATEGTPAEPYARIVGALAGGGVTAAGQPIIRSLNRITSAATGSGFLDPAAEAQARVADALQADGGAAPAVARTQDYASSGASSPALIDVAGNNVRRLVRAAASSPGEGQNIATSYADRVRANLQDNVTNRTRQLVPGVPQNASDFGAQLAANQGTQAAADYAPVRATQVQLDPQTVAALRGPDGAAAIQRAFRGAQANQDYDQVAELQSLQGADLDHPPSVSAGTLDRVRRAMGERGALAARNGAGDIAGGLFGRKAGIDATLDNVPELAPARANYRGAQAQIDAVPVGQGALNAPSNEYAAQVAQLSGISPDARTAAAVGHRQAILDAVERPAQGQTGILNRISSSTQQTQNLATSFGGDEGARFQRAVSNEVDRLRNANTISPNTGSQTEGRLADRSLVSLANSIPKTAWGFVASVVDKIRSGATLTPAERAEIVRIGTSEADLSALARNPRLNPAARAAIPAAVATGQINSSAP